MSKPIGSPALCSLASFIIFRSEATAVVGALKQNSPAEKGNSSADSANADDLTGKADGNAAPPLGIVTLGNSTADGAVAGANAEDPIEKDDGKPASPICIVTLTLAVSPILSWSELFSPVLAPFPSGICNPSSKWVHIGSMSTDWSTREMCARPVTATTAPPVLSPALPPPGRPPISPARFRALAAVATVVAFGALSFSCRQ